MITVHLEKDDKVRVLTSSVEHIIEGARLSIDTSDEEKMLQIRERIIKMRDSQRVNISLVDTGSYAHGVFTGAVSALDSVLSIFGEGGE